VVSAAEDAAYPRHEPGRDLPAPSWSWSSCSSSAGPLLPGPPSPGQTVAPPPALTPLRACGARS
jgi:hypothetical protein